MLNETANLSAIHDLVVNQRVDINTTDPDTGETLLHVAAEYGHSRCISWLLAHGAAHNIRNRQGETPLDVAHQLARRKAALVIKHWTRNSLRMDNRK
jgi:ankyrin repeat protein